MLRVVVILGITAVEVQQQPNQSLKEENACVEHTVQGEALNPWYALKESSVEVKH